MRARSYISSPKIVNEIGKTTDTAPASEMESVRRAGCSSESVQLHKETQVRAYRYPNSLKTEQWRYVVDTRVSRSLM
jgi:hypothetical protein